MEETGEEPPTSAVLLDHCHFSQIIFNSVEKFYIPGGDITCHYTLTQHFIPRRKDWVGIFRVKIRILLCSKNLFNLQRKSLRQRSFKPSSMNRITDLSHGLEMPLHLGHRFL
uniref:Calcium-binding and coiled-coil domain-containing protein 2 n=1 Tax=Monodelphis domestica TaxID=13616 RepID=F7EJ01_MONDO